MHFSSLHCFVFEHIDINLFDTFFIIPLSCDWITSDFCSTTTIVFTKFNLKFALIIFPIGVIQTIGLTCVRTVQRHLKEHTF